MSDLAPIILVCHARPDHTRAVLEALSRATLAELSDLHVYCDGARSVAEELEVHAVRAVIREQWPFRSIKIYEETENLGLRRSIVRALDQTFETHNKAILLEDDIIVHYDFLRYMNDALRTYDKTSQVWHINGWAYPSPEESLPDYFFWQTMHCWGWATWRDRWAHFERSPDRLYKEFTYRDRFRFNLNAAVDFWDQIRRNRNREIDTWAVFWYACIFKRSGLCLSPSQSYVHNIGFDGTGNNCGREQTVSHIRDRPYCGNLPAPCSSTKAPQILISELKPRGLKGLRSTARLLLNMIF
jgi:hypothetical protein